MGGRSERGGWLLAGVIALVAAPAAAQPYRVDPDTRDQVSFAVSRSDQVENDQMTVTLAAFAEDLDATRAADAVNRTMQEALPRVRAAEGVEFRTGSYSTNQVYPPQRPPSQPREPRWRVEQQLVLVSSDFEVLRDLTSALQNTLNLKGVAFGLSEERRIAEERRMADAALGGFREDAERIREVLGFAAYEIVELEVSHGGAVPVQRVHAARMMADASAEVAPVVLEGGSSQVRARVAARIQLLR